MNIKALSLVFATCVASAGYAASHAERPQIIAENTVGTAGIAVGVTPEWTKHARYLQQTVGTVDKMWHRIRDGMKAPARGTKVEVTFSLSDEGRILAIDKVKGDEAASRACVSAITEAAPFGEWSSAMKADLGTRQQVTLTFHYL